MVATPLLLLRAHRKDRRSLEARDEEILRITLHRTLDAHWVEQLVPYATHEKHKGKYGGGEGRKFSSRSGVVGRAFTTCDLVTGHRPAGQPLEEYIAELKEKWHMTDKDARAVSPDMFSFLAVPLGTEGSTPDGILFVACSRPNFFLENVIEITIACHESLVQSMKDRYSDVQKGRA